MISDTFIFNGLAKYGSQVRLELLNLRATLISDEGI